RETEAARRPRRRPVRRLPPARQQGGDAAGLRRDGDPRALRAHHGEGMTATTPATRRARRWRAVLWGVLGLVALAAVWVLYKLVGPADGGVVGPRGGGPGSGPRPPRPGGGPAQGARGGTSRKGGGSGGPAPRARCHSGSWCSSRRSSASAS